MHLAGAEFYQRACGAIDVAGRDGKLGPARHLAIGPPDAVGLIAELGEHPRDRWAEIHERHRSHFAAGA